MRFARKGVGFVPEDRRIFSRLSVEENLEIGAFKLDRPTGWTLERIYGLFPKLELLKAHKGNQLSGGEQQMLAIARALMGAPKLVLLDEPSEGLAPVIVKDVGEMIGTLKNEGITVLLVEQNARFACRLSDRVYIIDNGRVRLRWYGGAARRGRRAQIALSGRFDFLFSRQGNEGGFWMNSRVEFGLIMALTIRDSPLETSRT